MIRDEIDDIYKRNAAAFDALNVGMSELVAAFDALNVGMSELVAFAREIADEANGMEKVHDPNAELIRDWSDRMAAILVRMQRLEKA